MDNKSARAITPVSEQEPLTLDVPLLPKQQHLRDPNAPLPLDKEGHLQLTANSFVSARTLILGQSGFGKGNAGALIAEFLLEAGLPCTFLDLEGECYSLKEISANLLVVGRSAHADREYSPAQMGRLAELSVEQRFSVVLDLSGYLDSEIFDLLVPYLTSLWAVCDRLRIPYGLYSDEIHELIPQEGSTPVKNLLLRIAKRGRKRGLGLIGLSQETASLDKKFLRQTDVRILLPVSYKADLDIYHTLIPGVSPEMLKQTMPTFPPGTAYVIYRHTAQLVSLHRRRSFDPSETPQLGERIAEPHLQALDPATLHLLDQVLPSPQGGALERQDRASLIRLVRALQKQVEEQQASFMPQGDDSHQANLQQQIELLQEDLRQKQEHIAHLTSQLKNRLHSGVEESDAQSSGTHQEKKTWEIAQATIHSLVIEGKLPAEAEHGDYEAQIYMLSSELATAQRQLEEQVKEFMNLRQALESAQREPAGTMQSSELALTPIDAFLWEPIQHHITSLDPTARMITRILFAYEQKRLEQSFTLKELAARLPGLQQRVEYVRQHFPNQLVDLGLLVAVPRGSAHTLHYRSQARAYLGKEFAEQQIEPLLEELQRLLQ